MQSVLSTTIPATPTSDVTDATDAQLLTLHVNAPRGQAFSHLVRRHLPLVYSIALRQTRDPHLADDVSQSVFIILARRAHILTGQRGAYLPAWLVKTTRYAASNALKMQSRRQRHEHEAASMTPISTHDRPATADLTPLLHEGLASLGKTDRTAVILRYLHSKTAREISADLGITESAAQKRVLRSLEKIRAFFSRKGIATPADAIAAALSSDFLQPIPAALFPAILAQSLSPSVPTSLSLLTSKTLGTMAIAKTKLALLSLSATAALIIGGVCIELVLQETSAPAVASPSSNSPPNPSTTPPLAEAPDTFPNDSFTLKSSSDLFEVFVDPDTKRGDEPAVCLSAERADANASANANCGLDAAPYHGKRIRFSAYAKTKDIDNSACLRLLAIAPDQTILRYDEMCDRSILGTTDWTKYELVTDIPESASLIVIGGRMRGKGTLWFDSAQIEIVADTTPMTDDRNWHLWAPYAGFYAVAPDPDVTRNGHPTTRVFSTSPRSHGWGLYTESNRSVEKYIGHKIRMTAWIKSEGITQRSGLSLRVIGTDFNELANEGQRGKRPILGTSDWKKYEVITEVPEGATSIGSGVSLTGKGKLWIDDVQYELID